MSKMFLLNVVETEPLVRSEPSCKDLLLGAMKYHLLPDQRSDFASKQTEQRSPDGLMPYIFAIGKFARPIVYENVRKPVHTAVYHRRHTKDSFKT